MKKGLTIVLMLVLFTNINTSISQLIKLPVLIEHYQEHAALDESITLWQYIYEHYLTDTIQADFARDRQLPFKDLSGVQNFLAIGIIHMTDVSVMEDNPHPTYIQSLPKHLFALKMGMLQSYQGKIFQPPKYA